MSCCLIKLKNAPANHLAKHISKICNLLKKTDNIKYSYIGSNINFDSFQEKSVYIFLEICVFHSNLDIYNF